MARRVAGRLVLVVLLAAHAAVAATPEAGTTAPQAEAREGTGAATPEARARQAVETYTRALETGDRDARLAAFRQARRLFADVAAAGSQSPELYTNLGNAALQSEQLGQAVLAYRRALRLEPAWVPRPEPPGLLDSFFFWHHTLPASMRALLGALAFAVGALLLAASLRWERPTLRTLALLPGLLWLGLAGSLVLDRVQSDGQQAVLTANEAVARAADSALAPAALPEPLPGGTEVEVVGSRSPWLRVRLANGRDAWLPESSVTPIAAPAG
jgi:tetratricopeptide (TPR) repeat protein